MDDSDKNNDLAVKELRLIDFSSEDDDCFLDSFSRALTEENEQDRGSFDFLEDGDASKVDVMAGTLEQGEHVPQPFESFEPETPTKKDKYNLRKSLAWDTAFFTSAGVLDPEELSSIIDGVEKGGKHVLPIIQEDIYRSTESISSLESDSLTLESLEADLFEDIRASIQKSTKLSNVENSSIKAGATVTETQTTHSSTEGIASRKKMNSRTAIKKSNVGIEGSVKTAKQISVCPQVSQCVVASGNSSSSLPKPPKVVGRANSISTTSTKRASLDTNLVKMDKDSARSITGKGAPVSKVPALGARTIVPRLRPSSKTSSSGSSTTKTELTNSCSSFDSSGSAASNNIGISALNSMKRKIDSRNVNPSSGSTVTLSRIASRNKFQTGNSHLIASLMSITNLSSSISPTSSISEWSSESSSSTSVNQRSNSSRASLDTTLCKEISGNGDAPEILGSQKKSNNQSSVEHEIQVTGLSAQCIKKASIGTGPLFRPPSVQLSGLRMPSPKLGFFDGVKSGVRTPNGTMQFHPGILSRPRGLSKIGSGTGSVSPIGGSNKPKHGKLQPARTVTAIRNTKSDTWQTASGTKPISPIPRQEPSNASTEVSSASRNVKSFPGISQKVQNKFSQKSGGECHLKTGGVEVTGCDIAKHESDFGSIAENNGKLVLLRSEASPEIKGSVHEKESKVSPSKGEIYASSDSNSMHNVENIAPSQNRSEEAIRGQNYLKNNLHSFNYNKKEKTHFEDQVDGLCRHVEAVDINAKINEELIGSSVLELGKSTTLTFSRSVPKENSGDSVIV